MSRPIRKFLDYEYPIGAVAIGYTLIVIGIASFFITESIILSLILIILGIYLASSYVGILIDLDKRKFKYYKSRFGLKNGDWKFFKYYPYLSLLTLNQNQTTFSQTNAQNTTRFIVYRIYLLNEKHTEKLQIKEFRNKLTAEKYLENLVNELNLETDIYSPDFS